MKSIPPEAAHDAVVADLFRRQSGRLVAALTRALGPRHVALAEDAVQDAMVKALQQWPYRGTPDQPAAWLYQVARNRALDRLRHERLAGSKAPATPTNEAGVEMPDTMLAREALPLDDDELGLMSLTCHPALSADVRVSFTLKLVGGFSVQEIARAHLAMPAAIAQRLVRARRQLRESGADFGIPAGEALRERLASMHGAIYLMFNEGYAATSGDVLIRRDVAREAIRLGRLLAGHPGTDTPVTWALLALMLLHASRFDARVSAEGELLLMESQDRSRWDRQLIAEGMRSLHRASAGEEVSRYHLEAAIAACHAAAARWEDTDWSRIAGLYDELHAITASPVVALNRAIARARVHGPVVGLEELAGLMDHPRLQGYYLRHAAAGALWDEAGHPARAAASFRLALEEGQAAPERHWLAARLAALDGRL